jgi:hypothetical protein
MRCTQYFGLSASALEFLDTNAKKPEFKTCPTCGNEQIVKPSARIYASAKEQGMFSDGPELYEYDLQDGRVAREVVQAVPWSSGPCIFLCLEIDGEKVCQWPEEDLNNA